MNIQEAIKQTSFESSKEKALVNVLFTYNWLRDQSQHYYKKHGIRMQHFNVLRILNGKHPEPVSPGEIKDVMLDKSPDLTRLLDKLVKLKLVDRDQCPENRRKVDVRITDKGIELLKELKSTQEEINSKIGIAMTDEEAEQLSSLLDKLRS